MPTHSSDLTFEQEVLRRRTFAIISHPDAGKTTITEKILWHGGAIREAGEVKGKKGTKKATSDWMSMEQERGVSITSSVMQFGFRDLIVNLLDTPGHKDFGEDTYRTLVAADSAAMLIDAAKGVEAQTRKLYEVCRMRKLPIFTFANKMDREGKDPLELIDDVENTLGMTCYPVTWPIGMGDRFQGVFHRMKSELFLYEKGVEKPKIVPVKGPEDPEIDQHLRADNLEKFREEMELLELAIGEFSQEKFLAGKISPMTFGSAKFNWGVDVFLELFADLAPSPSSRKTTEDNLVLPADQDFTAFAFKIQANMDKRHRDRIAFFRVCSGRFERGMKVKNTRLGKEIRLAYANQFMAGDRETVDEAFPGDILGVIDPGNIRIGDTVTQKRNLRFDAIPRFSPEHFARVTIKDPLKRKQLQKGLAQLSEEGTIQLFYDPVVGISDPILGAVGELQFDVLLHRLKDEYKLEVKLERLPYSVARWPVSSEGQPVSDIKGGTRMFEDEQGQPVVLLEREWDLGWLQKENPEMQFKVTAGETA